LRPSGSGGKKFLKTSCYLPDILRISGIIDYNFEMGLSFKEKKTSKKDMRTERRTNHGEKGNTT
jgi:hypothetical protein